MGCKSSTNKNEDVKLSDDLKEFENFYTQFHNDLCQNISKDLFPIDENWIINWTKYNLTKYVFYDPSHNKNIFENDNESMFKDNEDLSKYMSSFFVYSKFINELLNKYGDSNTKDQLISKKGKFFKGMCLIENSDNIIEIIKKNDNYILFFPEENSKQIILKEINLNNIEVFLEKIKYRKEKYKYIWRNKDIKEANDNKYYVYIFYKRHLLNDIHWKIHQYLRDKRNGIIPNSDSSKSNQPTLTNNDTQKFTQKEKDIILNQMKIMDEIIKDLKSYELAKKKDIFKSIKEFNIKKKDNVIERENSLSKKIAKLIEEIEKRKNLLYFCLNKNEKNGLNLINIKEELEDNIERLNNLKSIKTNFDKEYEDIQIYIKEISCFRDKTIENKNFNFISYKNTITLIECLSEIKILSSFYENDYSTNDSFSNDISNEFKKIILYLWGKRNTYEPYSIKNFYDSFINECHMDEKNININENLKIILHFLLNHFNQEFINSSKKEKSEKINNFSEDELPGIFNGVQKTRKICCNCFYETYSFQNIIDIEIPLDKVVAYLTFNGKYIFSFEKYDISLTDCLKYFILYSIIKNEKTEICNDCNANTFSFIVKNFQKLPKILVIILNQTDDTTKMKRGNSLLYSAKIPKEINLEFLINPKDEDDNNNKLRKNDYNYELLSIIYENNIENEINPFTAYFRDRNINQETKWYYYNESFEKKYDKYNEGLPFILFYERK